MGRVYLQSIRLAVALVCLGASLILASHWLGLLPNEAAIRAESRRRLSESVAINLASHVRKQQWVELKAITQTIVDRDPSLLSIGVRTDRGVLKADAGHHHELWAQLEKDPSAPVEAVQVPITLNRRQWGTVQFCFGVPERSLSNSVWSHPLVRLLAFFCIAGTVGYTLFVGKMMRVFSTTQVVPERVRQALDTLAEGLLVLDERARIVLANRAFAQTVDVPEEMLAETSANDLPWRDQDDAICEDFPWMTAIDESATITEKKLQLQVGDGERRIFSVNAAPIGGGARRGALATFRDVTEIEEHQAELETMLSMLRHSRDEIERKNKELEILATRDALTGCLNRRAFFERFGRLWKQVSHDKPLSCIMVDNDHFKSVNDTYGHGVGDDVLRNVASVLTAQFAERGLLCRYGGEEFCIVLPDTSLEEALQVAGEARRAIEAIRLEHPSELRLTASLGVSETRFEADEPQELINQADICLYAAKRSGRNCVIAFSQDVARMEEEAGDRPERKSRNIPFQAVTALVSTLSYRDANTAEHSRRVASLCSHVAPRYMDSQDVYLLEIAALLHDIGKVGVPDDILLKPGKLSDTEWETMSRHDRVGVEIIASAFDCPDLTKIIQSRYAHFDGNGRLHNQLSGEDIPLGGRILAICDSYDSMVSDRVYRRGRSHAAAIEELRRCAGTQFDPELVEHFISVVTGKPEQEVAASQSETAIQIGFQVERLAAAITAQDADGLKSLAARLGLYARSCKIDSIAEAAKTFGDHAGEEDISWLDLLRETNQLLDICRAAQTDLLRQSLDSRQQADSAR
ncbi:MAG: diguanylate cyclase [Planctomycetota bacterium]